MSIPIMTCLFFIFVQGNLGLSGGAMHAENSGQTMRTLPSPAGIPVEAGSSSELLSATHIFTVEIQSVEATKWSDPVDGLQHRDLEMAAMLLETFKGKFQIRLNQIFPLKVTQSREGEFVQSDYHGLWSEMSPEKHTRYLVIAIGDTDSPAALMQEGACQQLLTADFASDVKLTIAAERVFADSLGQGDRAGSSTNASLALLSFAQNEAKGGRDLFARYLWARINPTVRKDRETILPKVLALITSPEMTTPFRGSLISDISESANSAGSDSESLRDVIRAFLNVLVDESAKPLHGRLVEVQLYNMVFSDGKPTVYPDAVIRDTSEADRLDAVLTRLNTDRARKLRTWVNAGKTMRR